MVKSTITTTSPIDRVKNVRAALQKLDRVAVYVGVPEDKTARKRKDINNAQLVFLHTHGTHSRSVFRSNPNLAHKLALHSRGSPMGGIPPRPIIEPAIEAHLVPLTQELTVAGQAMLADKPAVAALHYKRAGQLGESYARGWFTDPRNNWAPLAPSTIAARQRKKRPPPYMPLIDTAQMRRSIIYVFGEE